MKQYRAAGGPSRQLHGITDLLINNSFKHKFI